jgi:hypothetical protein
MPAKPAWYANLDEVVASLDALPRPAVDSATLGFLLGVGRRRAQQILAPLVTQRLGASGLAGRDEVVARLRALAREGEGYWERRRRQRLATVLEGLRRERLSRPQLLVEAPAAAAARRLDDLPAGVRIEAGRITVEFDEPRQALEKLLALAMAIGNDFAAFEETVARRTAGCPHL